MTLSIDSSDKYKNDAMRHAENKHFKHAMRPIGIIISLKVSAC